MKIISFLLGFSFFSCAMLLGPFVLILSNDYLALPRFNNFFYQVIGLLLIILGIIIFFYCSSLFFFLGKGTPAPTFPPKHFVAVGLYKYTRNPIYLGYISVFWGIFLLFGHLLLLIYCLLFMLFLHFFVVYLEEPQLRKRFGEEYVKYSQKVPRWFLK